MLRSLLLYFKHISLTNCQANSLRAKSRRKGNQFRRIHKTNINALILSSTAKVASEVMRTRKKMGENEGDRERECKITRLTGNF